MNLASYSIVCILNSQKKNKKKKQRIMLSPSIWYTDVPKDVTAADGMHKPHLAYIDQIQCDLLIVFR